MSPTASAGWMAQRWSEERYQRGVTLDAPLAFDLGAPGMALALALVALAVPWTRTRGMAAVQVGAALLTALSDNMTLVLMGWGLLTYGTTSAAEKKSGLPGPTIGASAAADLLLLAGALGVAFELHRLSDFHRWHWTLAAFSDPANWAIDWDPRWVHPALAAVLLATMLKGLGGSWRLPLPSGAPQREASDALLQTAALGTAAWALLWRWSGAFAVVGFPDRPFVAWALTLAGAWTTLSAALPFLVEGSLRAAPARVVGVGWGLSLLVLAGGSLPSAWAVWAAGLASAAAFTLTVERVAALTPEDRLVGLGALSRPLPQPARWARWGAGAALLGWGLGMVTAFHAASGSPGRSLVGGMALFPALIGSAIGLFRWTAMVFDGPRRLPQEVYESVPASGGGGSPMVPGFLLAALGLSAAAAWSSGASLRAGGFGGWMAAFLSTGIASAGAWVTYRMYGPIWRITQKMLFSSPIDLFLNLGTFGPNLAGVRLGQPRIDALLPKLGAFSRGRAYRAARALFVWSRARLTSPPPRPRAIGGIFGHALMGWSVGSALFDEWVIGGLHRAIGIFVQGIAFTAAMVDKHLLGGLPSRIAQAVTRRKGTSR